MSSRRILGPDGTIAQRLPNYEARPQQLQMAQGVAAAIAGARHLMAEAGTGVGKSFAYLVPAIQAACADKECKVVISTHTISLQEQIIRKDIPFLQKVMPDKFAAVLVKGRGNYLSKRRLRVARQRGGLLLPEFGMQEQLQQLTDWARVSVFLSQCCGGPLLPGCMHSGARCGLLVCCASGWARVSALTFPAP